MQNKTKIMGLFTAKCKGKRGVIHIFHLFKRADVFNIGFHWLKLLCRQNKHTMSKQIQTNKMSDIVICQSH